MFTSERMKNLHERIAHARLPCHRCTHCDTIFGHVKDVNAHLIEKHRSQPNQAALRADVQMQRDLAAVAASSADGKENIAYKQVEKIANSVGRGPLKEIQMMQERQQMQEAEPMEIEETQQPQKQEEAPPEGQKEQGA